MTAKEVSERLTVSEFLALCEAIDFDHGSRTKFEVIKVERAERERMIRITVLFDKYRAEDVMIQMRQDARRHSCQSLGIAAEAFPHKRCQLLPIS